MDNKRVSVIMSCFNSEETVSTSIQSLISQDYKNTEILIMDDGSSDNTFKILKTFEDSYKNIKVYQNKKNIGLTRSLNILIQNTNGEIIARQDADDLSLDIRISNQLKYMESKNLDACTTRAFIKDTKNIIPGISYYLPHRLNMIYKNPFIHGTLMIKKKVIEKIGLYNEKFYFSQDFKLMRDLIDNNYKLSILNQPLYMLNMKNNLSESYKLEQKYFANCARKRIDP